MEIPTHSTKERGRGTQGRQESEERITRIEAKMERKSKENEKKRDFFHWKDHLITPFCQIISTKRFEIRQYLHNDKMISTHQSL